LLGYDVQMDDGLGGGFKSISSGLISVLKTTVTSVGHGVKKGLTYRFIYRAKNVNGFGEFSDSTSILAATVPEPPLPLAYVASSATTITVKINPSV